MLPAENLCCGSHFGVLSRRRGLCLEGLGSLAGWLLLASGLLLVCGSGEKSRLRAAEGEPRKIVVIAGKKSHGPEGNGIHDYGWSARLIKVMLDNSNVAERVSTQFFLDGWPEQTDALETADTIAVISDGRDGDLFEEAPFLAQPERVALIARQVARGCGFVTFHFSTFAPDSYAPQVLDWTGGYFDWETDGKRQWYSAITTLDTPVEIATPDHPVARGLKPVQLREEFYYNIRFASDKQGVVPLWRVPALQGREPDGRVVAWARERANGGRGFGTTCGHFYDNWKQPQFRKLVLNALLWTARAEIPADGVDSRFYSHDQILAALSGLEGTTRAVLDDRPIRVLLLAGNDKHKWHNWEKTTPAMKAALERDPRITVDVITEIDELQTRPLADYQVILQNYVNWQDPRPLPAKSRAAFLDFVQNGGGLLLVHFANGAWHFSLPMAEAAQWPEYQRIVRRMWNHKGDSGHDAFGRFRVEPTGLSHPVVDGLQPFDVTDELYFRQAGDQPIEPLLQAKSKVTGQTEPLAWTHTFGKGRVFQTLLGHSEQTYESFEPREMLRRATAWTAGRTVYPLRASDDPGPAVVPAPAVTELLPQGVHGKGLETRRGGAVAKGKPEYRAATLTVELQAKLFQKEGYNILIASELKSSPTHWELFTQPGSGHLTLYSPGMQPDHVGTTVNVADGRWHAIGYVREPNRVRLYVDGKQVADAAVKAAQGRSTDDGLGLGTLVDRQIGCAGWLDEIRISNGVRDLQTTGTKPMTADEQTVGLWSLDELEEGHLPDSSKLKNVAVPVK